MKTQKQYGIYFTVFIISLISSIILAVDSNHTFCSGGCNIVQQSVYASFLGIKNYYYGIIIFSILTLISASQILNPSRKKEKIINISIISGSLVAIYFLYLQEFVIKAFCKYCFVVDIGLLSCLLTLAITKWKK